jgi:hypothetical protein
MIGSLPRGCHRVGTCRGSGASSTRSRSRTVCALIRASARCRHPGSYRRRACGGGSPCSAVRSCCSCGSSCGARRGTRAGGRSWPRLCPRAGTWRPPRALRPFIFTATYSALARADSLPSMANTALSAHPAHLACAWLVLLMTLRRSAPCTAGTPPAGAWSAPWRPGPRNGRPPPDRRP